MTRVGLHRQYNRALGSHAFPGLGRKQTNAINHSGAMSLTTMTQEEWVEEMERLDRGEEEGETLQLATRGFVPLRYAPRSPSQLHESPGTRNRLMRAHDSDMGGMSRSGG